MDQIIRVLVIDDSAYHRNLIKKMLSQSPFIEVVDIACDGEIALKMVEELNPDVVTLDMQMPTMDGIAFLEKQMAVKRIPVIVVSYIDDGGERTKKAMQLGAFAVVEKPTSTANDDLLKIGTDLIEKVKMAAKS